MTDTERSRTFWDSVATTYDRRSAWLEKRVLARGRTWVCSRAAGDVLDVGVGTGANLPHVPRGTRLTGIDHSPAMVDVARQRAHHSGLDATLLQGDAGALPFPDATFDTALSTFVLCCVPNEHAALDEMVRVLRPGGRLLLADHVVSTSVAVRAGQRLLKGVTAPGQGERFTRRPAEIAQRLPGVDIVESERRALGVMEQVHAVRR